MAKCVVQYSGVFFGRLTPRPNSAALDVMGMSLLVECDIGESNYAYVQGYDVKVNDTTTNNAKPQSELYSRVSCYSEKRGISPCMRAHSQENLASPAGKTALMSEYERRLRLQLPTLCSSLLSLPTAKLRSSTSRTVCFLVFHRNQ